MMRKNAVADFWKWFGGESGAIGRDLSAGKSEIVREVNDRVNLAMPGTRWEIGPSEVKEWFFALSLNGDLDRLAMNEDLLLGAPVLKNWEFLPSKPRKSWTTRELRLRGEIVRFDEWRIRPSDDVVFFWPSRTDRESLTEDELEAACWFLIEAELGELEALTSIVEVVMRDDDEGLEPEKFREAWLKRSSE